MGLSRAHSVVVMERQAGLGKSLDDVLDALAPVEADPSAPGRVLFEPRELERQVDQLAAEICDLRERVQRLVDLVPDAAVANGSPNGTHGARPGDAVGNPADEREQKAGKHKSEHKKKHKKRKKKERARLGSKAGA
jgi:hypothetical protein